MNSTIITDRSLSTIQLPMTTPDTVKKTPASSIKCSANNSMMSAEESENWPHPGCYPDIASDTSVGSAALRLTDKPSGTCGSDSVELTNKSSITRPESQQVQAESTETAVPKQDESSEMAAPKQAESSEMSVPKQAESSETSVPKQAESSEMAAPKQAESSEMAAPKQAESSEMAAPKQAESSEMAAPKQAESSEMAAPKQAESSEMSVPKQAETSEVAAPKQAESSEMAAPKQDESSETPATRRAESSETAAPKQAESPEMAAPKQDESSETAAPKQAESSETAAPKQAESKQDEPSEMAISEPTHGSRSLFSKSDYFVDTNMIIAVSAKAKLPENGYTAKDLGIEEDEFAGSSDIVFSDPADLDMLDKLGNKNNNTDDNSLARQSLYVKFDPLVKGPNLDKNKNLRNPPKSVTDGLDGDENLMLMSSPHPEKQPAHPSRQAVAKETKVKDTVQDVDKIWSFDNQDMDGVDTSHDQSTDGQRNSKLNFPDSAESAVLKYTQADFDKWKKEIELDLQAKLLTKEQEWQKAEVSYKNKIHSLVSNLKEAEKVIKQYDLILDKVVESGEKKLTEQKKITAALEADYDKAQTDLDSFENAYSDICHRYEQLKIITDTLKKNEISLKTIIEQYKQKLAVHEEKYELLKKHAEDKLYEAKDQLERSIKTNQNEITLLKAALKRAEVKTDSLEQQIEQKVKENRELTSICDDLLKAQSASKK